MQKTILVIGGVAAGMSFATRYRRLNENDQIIVLEQGTDVSFANCGLPYYIGGVIDKRQKLQLQNAADFKNKFNIEVRVRHRAMKLDPKNHEVEIADLTNNSTYKQAYSKVVLATGAKPFIPPLPGLETAENIFTLRNLSDVDLIKEAASSVREGETFVLGGGFIGLEMAENLAELGLKVTLIEAGNQIMAALDEEMSYYILDKLRDKGIRVLVNTRVTAFDKNKLMLSDNTTVTSALTIAAMGVRPDSQLAGEAGLPLTANGSVKVDAYFKVADDIYAVGDVISSFSPLTSQEVYVPLANPANRQGRLLADILNGAKIPYKGIIGTSIVKIFDISAGSVGLNEKQLQKNQFDYYTVHGHAANHASYYPGASGIHYKLIFNQKGEILGYQAVGQDGVDKRLDVFSTAIKGHMTVYDLIELETAYAPPFGSAKDPVIMACYAATNILEGKVKSFKPSDVAALIEQGAYILDVRNENERANGRLIEHAVSIPLPGLRARIDELPRDKPLYIHCESGVRSYNACRTLEQLGFDCYNLDGGYSSYEMFKTHQ